ncbi:MAG: SDR family NAD(P)-dependent oxidoreductase [bacterium]
MELKGKVAVVTGAGRGIGKAIALALAGKGATVVLVSRSKNELEAVQAEIQSNAGQALAVPTDLTDDRQVEALFTFVHEHFNNLDILVNNAGIGHFAPFRDLTIQEFDEMWKLNIRGVFVCTKYALPLLEKNPASAIINISSLAGKNAFVNGTGYAATKWALMGFAGCLMLEVRERGVRVITICPGSVATTFSHTNDAAREAKIIHPQDIAETILTALKIPDRTMVSEIDIRPTNPK